MSDSPAIETARPEEEEVVIVRRGRSAGQSRGRGRGRGRTTGRTTGSSAAGPTTDSAETTGAGSGAGEGEETRGRSMDRRYRFRARLTRNGAVAIRGMNRREPDQEQVMFLSEWIQLSKFLNSKGFDKFQEHNRDKLRVRGPRGAGGAGAGAGGAGAGAGAGGDAPAASSTAPVGPYERAASQAPPPSPAAEPTTGATIETEDM